MRRRSLIALVAVLAVLTALTSGVAQGAVPGKPSASRVVLYSSDGMRPDLMRQYSDAGFMPTYAALRSAGVEGANGMVQAFPPNTGVGWYTMATGTYPSEHGSTNNTFHRTGDLFSNRTSFSGTGILQADTIANAAERAGLKVAQVEWVGGRLAGINGPTVDFTNFFSTRGVLTAPSIPDEAAGAATFNLSYQVASFSDALGWSNVPASTLTAKQTTLTITTTFASQNPTRMYDVYIYAAGSGYDHVLLVRTADGKNGALAAANLAVGDFEEVRLTGSNGLIGTRAGQTAGFYTKLITLAPDLSAFKLYFTSVERLIATCGIPACAALPGGTLENYLADNFPTAIAADFAPLEARIIDEETYVEQGRDLEAAYGDAVMEFILGTLQPDTDLALVGYPVTDEFSHQFMALYTPTDMDGNPNPYFDNVDGVGPPDGLVSVREGYVRSAYHEADAKLALARTLMGGSPTTFAGSDHGFAPQWFAVNANKVLNAATVNGISLHASNANASNCGAATTDLTKACWAGGTIQVYVNPTLPSGTTYEQVRTAVIGAFQSLTDPANPGATVISRIIRKEELRNVDGSDSLHPNRSGDVVVVTRPPYQSDAGTNNVAIAFSQFFGQHGYLPDLVDVAHNVNMHATFVAAGAGIRHQDPVAGIRAIDMAPTIAFLMGFPGPQNARGKILTNLFPTPGRWKTATILDISDYHGQLVPLSEAADTVGPAFAIGGAAFLKPWFDVYRAEAPGSTLTVAGGDSVGATPPISNFFGDTPTIELMNMMGFTSDGLGNHNFDRGQTYLRTELIPLATFPYLSANVVDPATGRTPAEWRSSAVFSFDGFKLGIVGFSNADLTSLIFPGNLDPFVVTPPIAAVSAEAARLKARGINAIVAIGHEGATGGTLTSPTGPLITLADSVSNVDAVVGDHSDFQVLATRPNGVLVTENRSKGMRFTRIRLVVDVMTKEVVYKTADFHKPWDIGVTPDPAIQARIDELNAQLAPIFNTVVGESTVAVPRGDACAAVTLRTDGRACESLVGDVVTDAMRSENRTDFAITNSGGLRADLTCPTLDNPSDFCPPSVYPIPNAAGHFPITRGQVLGVLPFGNVSATLTVNGAELKDYLETAVSTLPAVNIGRFGQVSGLCVTFDVQQTAKSFLPSGQGVPFTGNRVVSAVRQAGDGSCTGAPIDLTSASNYTLAINDFMASGGDGYLVVSSRITTQDILDQDLADYIGAQPGDLIGPSIQGRIHCTDSNLVAAPACPVGSP